MGHQRSSACWASQRGKAKWAGAGQHAGELAGRYVSGNYLYGRQSLDQQRLNNHITIFDQNC
jgi:hypothetical protein